MAEIEGSRSFGITSDALWAVVADPARLADWVPTMRRAQSSVRSPSGVNATKREPRCTSITPRISSSCLRLVDIVGWVTPQASAARPK